MVLNQRLGADGCEDVLAQEVLGSDRDERVGVPQTISAWSMVPLVMSLLSRDAGNGGGGPRHRTSRDRGDGAVTVPPSPVSPVSHYASSSGTSATPAAAASSSGVG